MKKLFIFIALASLMLIACDPKKDCYDFNKVLLEDQAMLSEQYDTLLFCEAQARYDDVITKDGDRKVIWMFAVWNLPDAKSVSVTHEEGKYDETPIIEVHDSPWVEDVFFDPNVNLSLPEALNALKSSDIVTPESKLVVLRFPLWYPAATSSYYIFGDSGTSFVKVNTRNGEVSEVSDNVETTEVVEDKTE